MSKAIRLILTRAAQKGLTIKKNQFKTGWSIILPGGICHSALSDGELTDYINNY